MNKKQVQQRVLQNGKSLALAKFSWDEKTKTFASDQDGLVIDFAGIYSCTFITGGDCTFKTGGSCTFTTGGSCTFTTGWYCTFTTGGSCTFTTGGDCTFTTGWNCTFKTGGDCTFTTGWYCTFTTGWNCTFKTGGSCTFTTGWYCTFTTGGSCTFTTGGDCTFKTGGDCTFTTGGYCTFTTGGGCTFKTGGDCVLLFDKDIIPLDPKTVRVIKNNGGYYTLNDTYYSWSKGEGDYLIIDNIPSKVLTKKGNVYKVEVDGKQKYAVTNGDEWAHGDTIKQAKESLIYKVSDRDTSMYDGYSLDTEVTLEEGIKMYRRITGACESETKEFVESIQTKDTYTVKEIAEITKGRFGNQVFSKFYQFNTQVNG